MKASDPAPGWGKLADSYRALAARLVDAGFEIDGYRREMLLNGLDEIGKTLLEEPRIVAFERRRAERTGPVSA